MNKKIRKNIKISKKNFFLIKRITLLVAFALICFSLVLVLGGAISLRERSMTIISSVNCFLEFVNIGRSSFVYTVANVAFSVIYFYVAIRAVIDVIECLKSAKKWLISSKDDKDTRAASQTVVMKANSCVFRYLLLMGFSYMVSSFYMGTMHILAISVLIGCSFAVNITKNILYKGEIVDSVVVAINRQVIMLSAWLLIIFSEIQIFEVINSVLRVFTSLETGTATSVFIGQMFADSILKPIFYFITWICLLVINKNVNNSSFEDEGAVKKIIIMDIVFLVTFMIVIGWTNSYTDFFKYLDMIWQNITLIVILAFTYISSMNVDSELKEIKMFGELNEENSANN